MQERLGLGVCIACGVPMPDTKFRAPRCVACNLDDRLQYAERIAAGLCPRCPEPIEQGHTHCTRHVEEFAYKSLLHQARKQGRAVSAPRKSAPRNVDNTTAAFDAICGEAADLVAELASLGGDPDTLQEFMAEIYAERDAKIEAIFNKVGWNAPPPAKLSTEVVTGDGRTLRTLPGVVVRRVPCPTRRRAA